MSSTTSIVMFVKGRMGYAIDRLPTETLRLRAGLTGLTRSRSCHPSGVRGHHDLDAVASVLSLTAFGVRPFSTGNWYCKRRRWQQRPQSATRPFGRSNARLAVRAHLDVVHRAQRHQERFSIVA